MRRRLPKGVKMYTGDDFNYPALIAGDAQGYSDALLGIFDAIAPAASAGLAALARGDMKKYAALMEPTVPLSRLIFRAPTQSGIRIISSWLAANSRLATSCIWLRFSVWPMLQGFSMIQAWLPSA